jgi:hypothetical protein
MEDTELAWAAGFFDGEGCVTGFITRGGEFNLNLIVAQSSTTEHLERFRDAVGYGTISGPYSRDDDSRRQPSFHWNCSGRRGHAVMALLRPYLCSPKLWKYDFILRAGRLPGPQVVIGDEPEPSLQGSLWEV